MVFAAARHSFDKVAADAKYFDLRTQKTDRADAAHDALRRQTPSAAREQRRTSSCTRTSLDGGRPAPLPAVADPQAREQRRTVEQIEEFVPMVQTVDVPVPPGALDGVQDRILQRLVEQILMNDTDHVIEVPKIPCSDQPPSSCCPFCYAEG